MLKKNEIWQACITPNDGIDDGATACSNNLTMANTAPTQGTTILNSTLGTNFATENLTVYNQSTADADGDKVTNIISWNRNATPIMMLYMPFDTNYSNHSISNITRDYSGLGHNGSGGNQDAAKSPKWNSSCMSGGCYKFDGSNDFIMLPATADFDTQRPTIEMWVYSNNYAQSGMLFEKTTNGAINTQYSIYFTGSSLYWQTYNTLSQIDDLIVSLATLGMSNSQWYHLTFIYNGTAKAIYVNGIQKGQAAYTQTLITNKAGTSIIGGSGSGTNPSYWYSGYIDELKLYNNTLTPEQIRINYNNSNRISSSSIKVNEVWQACITPNDGSDDGITTCSNNLTVIAATVNSAPNITEINITPSPANASSNLNCNFIITNSEESNSLSANVTWLNGGSIYKGYNISVTNGTQNVHVLQAANISRGNNWTCSVLPYDGSTYGTTKNASAYIYNVVPTQGTPILNSSSNTNMSNENLTVYNISTADADNDKVTNIISWNRNATPIMMLYMPFDTNYSNHSISNITKDYSGIGHNGSGGNQNAAKTPRWNSSCISGGCYQFDGINDFIMLPATADFDSQRPTIEMWVYSNNYSTTGMLFEKTTNGGTNTQYSVFFVSSKLHWRTTNNLGTINDFSPGLETLGISNGEWYHLTFIYNGTAKVIYVNAIQKAQTTYTDTLITNESGTSIIGATGSGTGGTYWFNGYIDELKLYNNTLTPEQIMINYNNSNRISSSSIKVNEIWHACITPNDGLEDGTTLCSNNVTIQSTPVPIVTEINITPSPANASSNLNCNFIVTGSTPLSVNVTWLNGGSIYKGYNISVTNGTQNVHVLQAANITRSQNWTCSVLPYNGITYGTTNDASSYIYNLLPIQGTPVLNSTFGTNLATENLTVYNQSTADADNDAVTNIINWYRNGSSIAVLNMPFDTNYTNHSISNVIKDYSGYGNNGTGGNGTSSKTPIWKNYGVLGGSYKFDGSNDFITIPASSALDVQRLTIEAWVNSSDFDQNGYIFEKTTNGTRYTQYSCYFANDATVIFYTVNSIGTANILSTTLAVSEINNNQWNHIACVYNGTAKALFVNGALKKMAAYTQTLQTNPAGTSIIGEYGTGNGYFFNGTIDELRVYNISLTPQQIAANYNAGAAKYNLIEESSTKVNETWQACITPNDGLDDGTTSC